MYINVGSCRMYKSISIRLSIRNSQADRGALSSGKLLPNVLN